MNELLSNPENLKNHSPKEWYEIFLQNGFTPRPLGRGNYKGIEFNDGGGYRVHWDGDKMFQYHPSKRSRYGGAYYKISSGITSDNRYDLTGKLLKKRDS
jgi:hypothetical protein